MTSFETRVSTCPLCGMPLAVGGPSKNTKGLPPAFCSMLFSKIFFSSQNAWVRLSSAVTQTCLMT